jgi:hypothetical protein
MWKKYLIKPPGKSRYWGIEFSPSSKRRNDQNVQIPDLGAIPVATPMIIQGLSAYHPHDQPKLLSKAI